MNEIYRAEVEKSLQDILSDAKFQAAPQMTAFLRYVVNETLNGTGNRIKAYTVAVEALGKPGTFDPQNDPSVRVLAKRLRDTLNLFYERTNGHSVFIRLERGSYVPKFVRNIPEQNRQVNIHLVQSEDSGRRKTAIDSGSEAELPTTELLSNAVGVYS